MLRISKRFAGKTVNQGDLGDVNGFLRNVLVEVAAENYRQLMYEVMALSAGDDSAQQLDLDPPLRANERVMSGLFSNAIAKVASRSRPEARIDRPESDYTIAALGSDNEDGGKSATAGRVDFLAWYGNRVIGIELKMASMNCETPRLTEVVKDRWGSAVEQSKTVQSWLRTRQKEDEGRYPSPVSLALMVVVGRRNTALDGVALLNDGVKSSEVAFNEVLTGLRPRPTFHATYLFPEEFRCLALRRNGKAAPEEGRAMYTPFVSFIARPFVKSAAS